MSKTPICPRAIHWYKITIEIQYIAVLFCKVCVLLMTMIFNFKECTL